MKKLMMLGAMSVAMCGAVQAQTAVHAVLGTVIVANTTSMILSLRSDDGHATIFHMQAKKDQKGLHFDKEVQAKTTPAEESKAGDYVVVFYTGDSGTKTAVGVEDLGAAAPEHKVGTISEIDKKSHVVTLACEAAGPSAVTISEKTVVDTPSGVVMGSKYHPVKGDRVEVKSAKGDQVALFVGTPAEGA